MRFRRTLICALAVAIGSVAMVNMTRADEKTEGAIKARQALMALYAINLRQLGEMAKGDQAYDAKKAKVAAENLRDLAAMNNSVLWPQGSDNSVYPNLTRAKAEAWTTYPASRKYQEALIAAAGDMAEAADTGVENVASRMAAIGKSCGGCHKEFRAPK